MLSQSTGHTKTKLPEVSGIGTDWPRASFCVMLKVELPMLLGFNPEWEHRVNPHQYSPYPCLHRHFGITDRRYSILTPAYGIVFWEGFM